MKLDPPRGSNGRTRALARGLLALCIASGFLARGEVSHRLGLEDLRQVRLPDVAIESAKAVTADVRKGPAGAAYVDVKGVIGGNIRFELLLPDGWNGRFVMGGGGGFVGSVQGVSLEAVNQGYATAGTDTGHEWQPNYMATWAKDNLEAQWDFEYLAVHRTAEVAKALIHAYYGTDAAYSYFTGCSRGGGQAMMEAQRYQKDFDGIVAGGGLAFSERGLDGAWQSAGSTDRLEKGERKSHHDPSARGLSGFGRLQRTRGSEQRRELFRETAARRVVTRAFGLVQL